MKGVFCTDCWDMVMLSYQLRSCRCGKVSGMYRDERNAVTNGEGIAFAFGNGDFQNAKNSLNCLPPDLSRKDYQKKCKLNYVWMRPHTGSGNPHSFVDKELRDGNQ